MRLLDIVYMMNYIIWFYVLLISGIKVFDILLVHVIGPWVRKHWRQL